MNSLYVISHEELANARRLTREITKNKYVLHLPQVAINYTVTDTVIVINSEFFGDTTIDFSDKADCLMCSEYAVLAAMHKKKRVATGGVIHDVNFWVNMPNGEYEYRRVLNDEGEVVHLHGVNGTIFMKIDNIYLPVDVREALSIYNRYIRHGVGEAIQDDYLVRIVVGDEYLYIPMRWCYKTVAIAILLNPGTHEEHYTQARAILDNYFGSIVNYTN